MELARFSSVSKDECRSGDHFQNIVCTYRLKSLPDYGEVFQDDRKILLAFLLDKIGMDFRSGISK